MPGDPDRHPVDVVADDLIRLYEDGARRLTTLIATALRRGLDPRRVGTPGQQVGDASTAYRARALAQARAILEELRHAGARQGPAVAGNAYDAGLFAIDRALGGTPAASVTGSFGRVHQRAVNVYAANLGASLEQAAATAGANVEAVFARAAILDGALPPEGLPGGPRFIGRRIDDPWRELALRVAGGGTVSLQTRRQLAVDLHRRLLTEGVADAVTGFVDARGARWPLHVYAAMAMRTVTREAASRSTLTRLEEHGIDLVQISRHPHREDVCSPYDGQVFSRSGTDSRYPRLDRIPPFHPRCRHVLGPANLLDDYERELGLAAHQAAGKTSTSSSSTAAATLPAPRPPAPPLSLRAAPRANAATLERLQQQRTRALLEADPGPEPGARAAWEAAVKVEDRNASKALDATLGKDLGKFIDRAWGRKQNLRRRLLDGELTVADVEDLAVDEWHRLEHGRAQRKGREETELRTKQIPCFVCGRFKRRPADICDYCGDDPVTYGGSAESFNRNFGYGY